MSRGGATVGTSAWATVVLCAALAGCNQTAATVGPVDTPSRIVARAGVSPRGASVAIVDFDGGPADTGSRFSSAFADAATARDITIATPDRAAYLLRGYLTATPVAEGVRLTYVWDLFDRRKQRAQRLSESVVVPPRGADPWAAADDLKIGVLATRGAQDLADVLTNMPEAVSAAVAPGQSGRSARRDEGATADAR